MAYSKLQKTIQDFALGFQGVNQARDNADQLQSDLGQKHGRNLSLNAITTGPLPSRPGAVATYPWKDFGRHDDLLVPRGVARIDVIGTSGSVSWWFQTQSPSIFSLPWRYAVGVYFFGTTGLGANPWADVSLQTDGAIARFADCRYYAPGSGYEGFLVNLWSLDAGAFTADDYSFSLRVRSTNAV